MGAYCRWSGFFFLASHTVSCHCFLFRFVFKQWSLRILGNSYSLILEKLLQTIERQIQVQKMSSLTWYTLCLLSNGLVTFHMRECTTYAVNSGSRRDDGVSGNGLSKVLPDSHAPQHISPLLMYILQYILLGGKLEEL